ncbi:MAG: hypothetical protein IJM65_00755 [Bacteroidales bacterium]|nr:hypothetical protein [Bacteroidales bacterium]
MKTKIFRDLYSKYLKRLFLLTIFILALFVLCSHCWPFLLSPFCIYLIIFFLVVMAGTHAIVLQADAERLSYVSEEGADAETQRKAIMDTEKKFIRRYLIATTVKLMLFLVLLVAYAFTNRDDMLRFGLNFIVLYLIYSIFEVLILKKPLLK